MFRKDYFRFLVLTLVCLAGATLVTAQTAPIRGKVVLKKADGTTVPVEGAVVEGFKMDAKGSVPTAKTNKKGEFGWAGVILGTKLLVSVSAPGISPTYVPNVPPGADNVVITVSEGDGKRLSEAEVRSALAGSAPAGTSSPGTTAGTGNTDAKPAELTAEQKKAQAEYEAKVKEVSAKNEDIKNKNSIIEASLKAGNEAFNSKNYDAAVAEWNKGIAADPDYAGSAPVLLINKGTALKIVGIDAYNRGVRATDPAEKAALQAKAKTSLDEALKSYENSWTILKKASPSDVSTPGAMEKYKYDTLAGLTELYRLVVVTKANPAKAAESKEAFESYIAIETDAAKKSKAQLTYADMMREAGDSENAIAGYRAVLASTPDNGEAMAGLGLSLFNAGVVSSNKEQMQEGLNYMTKYIESSPIAATDSASTKEFKQSVKDAVEYLKTTEKLAPQKVSTPGKRKG